MHTTIQTRRADAMARDLMCDAVRGRRWFAREFLLDGIAFIERGQQVDGADMNYLIDTARGLQDEISNRIGAMRRDLDAAGLDPDAANIDTSELQSLIVQIEAKTALAAKRGL